MVFDQELDAVHELSVILILGRLALVSTLQVRAAEGLLSLWIKCLHHLPWILRINAKCIEPHPEGIFLPLLQWDIIIVQEEIIQLEQRQLLHLGVGDLRVDDRTHDDFIGILQHHLVSGGLIFNLLPHLLYNGVLMGEPQDVRAGLAGDDITL